MTFGFWFLSLLATSVCRSVLSSDLAVDVDLDGSSRSSSSGPLLPSQLPKPTVFSALENSTMQLPNSNLTLSIALGSVTQINQVKDHSDLAPPSSEDFAVLPSIVDRESIEEMLDLLQSYPTLDEDPDTVDGMPTYEIFMHSPGLYEKDSTKVRDADPRFVPGRKALRKKLKTIMDPYLFEKITPFVKAHFPEACSNKGKDRECYPCYSLIRRYRHGERQSHATHHDGHAIVTVVVSLSDYGKDYLGGLYVSTGYGQREFLGLRRGDAVAHQSTLLHGVQVYDLEDNPADTERWSWILWYKDSQTCDDYSHQWFAECSAAGNAVCQQLHSTKVGNIPNLSTEEISKQVLELNVKAALGGEGNSAVKIARAYMKQLPSTLDMNVEKAKEFYQIAIDCHNADGHFGMAHILLGEAMMFQQEYQIHEVDRRVEKAVGHLEEAARMGHTFSMFNLGMAHIYGYVSSGINTTLGAEWMVQSGLPEGYFIASHQAASVGDTERQADLDDKARVLGFYQSWRKEARLMTGSGGAGGVDINLLWPQAKDGRTPPRF